MRTRTVSGGPVSIHRLRRLVGAACIMAVGSVLLAACTSPRNVLGTNSSPCFRALAVARNAVGGRGTFTGVRLLSARAVVADLRHGRRTQPLPTAVTAATGEICVVGYRGTFTRSGVDKVWPPRISSGSFAAVFVPEGQERVILTYLSVHPSLRFSRLFH